MPKRLVGGVVDYLSRNPDGPDDGLIICGRCLEWQPTEQFYLARARKHLASGQRLVGGTTRCRSCSSEQSYKFQGPRVELIDAARASGCVDCGLVDLDHPEIFDFDHVRGQKVRNISTYRTVGTLDELRAELAKCDVVCANCHRIRTRSRGAVTRLRDRRVS